MLLCQSVSSAMLAPQARSLTLAAGNCVVSVARVMLLMTLVQKGQTMTHLKRH